MAWNFWILLVVAAGCHGEDASIDFASNDNLPPSKAIRNVELLPHVTAIPPRLPHGCLPPDPEAQSQGKYLYYLAFKVKVGVRKQDGKKPTYSYNVSTREILDDEEGILDPDKFKELDKIDADVKAEATGAAKRYIAEKVPKWIYKNSNEMPDEVARPETSTQTKAADLDSNVEVVTDAEDAGSPQDIDFESTKTTPDAQNDIEEK